MSVRLITEVKQQWAMLVLGWVDIRVQGQLWDVCESELLFVTRLYKF